MATSLNLDSVRALIGHPAFDTSEYGVAGISGGRTSAMMAALLAPEVILTFQNTGREHPKTLDFLHRLDAALDNRIVWLEFRKPARVGAPPREFQIEVVDYETASRDGRPFYDFMEAIAEYRKTKGEPPIVPWARQRTCSGYLKHKVAEHYVKSLGIDVYDSFIGLRADEPRRVERLVAASTQAHEFRCPLYDVGITKPDINCFWKAQPFDLEIEDYQGNCTACFMKDQADLSRVLLEPETDANWWLALEEEYPDFGGYDFVTYARALAEAPMRLAISADCAAGIEPRNIYQLEPRRFLSVVRQERARLHNTPPHVSCSCEASMVMHDDDDL